MCNHKKESGTILITTLLLLAVVTIIAVGMAERSQIDIHRTEQILTAEQAYLAVKPAEIWAYENLRLIPVTASFPKIMPTIKIAGSTVSAILYDAQGEFYNLNNLSDPNQLMGFYTLLKSLNLNSEIQNQKALATAITSWISPLGKQTDTISDQYYLRLHPPYRAAHRLFVSPSELRLIKNINSQSYSLLIPYLIALPEITPININTATPILLTMGGLSINDANAVVVLRQQKGGFKTLNDFTGLPVMQKYSSSDQNYSITSSYYLLKTIVSLHHQELVVYSLFKKANNLNPNSNANSDSNSNSDTNLDDNTDTKTNSNTPTNTNKNQSSIQLLWQTRGSL